MVVGQGLVAKGFNSYAGDDKFLVFASGISNSSDNDLGNFEREKRLLVKTLSEYPDKTFVYFSTCSMYDKALQSSLYVQHKLDMEKIISESSTSFHIFRISNLAGKTGNPNTVLNYFIQHIISGDFFYLWKNASRNIIDIDDAYKICDYILQNKLHKNEIINIANPINYTVIEIVSEIEKYFNKKGNHRLLDKESNPEIDISMIQEIIKLKNINFDDGYLRRTIKKYFPPNDL